MFADAAERKFDLVLFWSLERFSREGVLETLQRLTGNGGSGNAVTVLGTVRAVLVAPARGPRVLSGRINFVRRIRARRLPPARTSLVSNG